MFSKKIDNKAIKGIMEDLVESIKSAKIKQQHDFSVKLEKKINDLNEKIDMLTEKLGYKFEKEDYIHVEEVMSPKVLVGGMYNANTVYERQKVKTVKQRLKLIKIKK